MTALLVESRRKAVRTTRLYALLSAGDLSRVRAELAGRPGCLCRGTLGEAGLNQPRGAGTRNLAAEKLEAQLSFPGCPGADVAVSHRVPLGTARGPKAFIGAGRW